METASQMVDAMQSSLVGVAYLALTVAPATEDKYSASLKVSDHLEMRLPSICSVYLIK